MTTFPIELIPFAQNLGIEIVEASAERVVGKLWCALSFAPQAARFMAAL